mmetsp:Transcript_62590/g.104176  ORF Transcript_62590/g.104176 Transcript_62590/m.104176 type:complete len:250 (-) Transcript_62590:286-1035(-)
MWTVAAVLRHMLMQTTVMTCNSKSSISPRWRSHLTQPLAVYAISCWFYSSLGLLVLAQHAFCPQSLISGWPRHVNIMESVLVIMQGLWSYLSDVRDVGQESFFHIVDRVSAISLTGLQFFKLFVIPPGSLPFFERCWLLACLLIGLLFKVFDYYCIVTDDVHAYRRSHTLWHFTFPFGFGCFSLHCWWKTAPQCVGILSRRATSPSADGGALLTSPFDCLAIFAALYLAAWLLRRLTRPHVPTCRKHRD